MSQDRTETVQAEKNAENIENNQNEKISENGSEGNNIVEDAIAEKEMTTSENLPQKKGKIKKIALFSSLAILAIILLVYGGIALYFQTHYLPNTTINGVSADYFTAADIAELLGKEVQTYKLQVIGRTDANGTKDVLGVISAEEIKLEAVNPVETAEQILAQQNEYLWINAVFFNEHQGYSVEQGVVFDKELLSECMKGWDAFQKDNMIEPKNAYISEYDEKTQGYEIIPETQGTYIKTDLALEIAQNAILTHNAEVDLDAENCYSQAQITSEDDALNRNLEDVNRWMKTQITYDWNGTEVVLDGSKIHEWITIYRGNASPKLDEEAVAQFVADNSGEFDTYGKNRKFMTTLGVELTLPSGAFGWKTDREGETEELLQMIYQGSVTEKEPLYISKAPNKGNSDIGFSYVEADLTNQHLYLYKNGELVLETDFVSGQITDPGCITPAGVFGLTYKTTNAVLRGENYETPVSYWMPFHGNFGMHDATWRTEFGGDFYLTRGSHGCINLPLDKAKEIYQYISTGFPVICYYY